MQNGNLDLSSISVFGKSYALPMLDGDSKTKAQIIMEATVLFAQNGYADVSIRDLAKVIGIRPASIYNHFGSKQALFEEVLQHAEMLYLLYFSDLEAQLKDAGSFEDIMEILCAEPKKMANAFTTYAFALVQMEQFSSPTAGRIFNEVFLKFSIDFIKNQFDIAVENGWAQPFDTGMVAMQFMHTTLFAIAGTVHNYLGRTTPYIQVQIIADLQKYILHTVGGSTAN